LKLHLGAQVFGLMGADRNHFLSRAEEEEAAKAAQTNDAPAKQAHERLADFYRQAAAHSGPQPLHEYQIEIPNYSSWIERRDDGDVIWIPMNVDPRTRLLRSARGLRLERCLDEHSGSAPSSQQTSLAVWTDFPPTTAPQDHEIRQTDKD
jgi:hypothetical protein